MRVDLIAGASLELLQQVLHVAGREVRHPGARRADDVVVVAVASEAVGEGVVVQHDLADDIELLEQPERCRSMGEAGVRRVRERFSWRRTAEETVALYEELLGRRAAEAPSLRVVSAE